MIADRFYREVHTRPGSNPVCLDCSNSGLIEAEATRVRYGRYANSTEIIAAVAAGPMTIRNRCHLCDTLPTVAVFALSPETRQ